MLLAVALGALLVLSGCGSSSDAAEKGTSAPTELTVFGASSLTEAFTRLGDQFRAAHPDVKVVFNFAGSQALVAQLQQGAPADVLACADTTTMQAVSGLVGPAQEFATNAAAIIAPAGNPKDVESLADLARADVKVILAAPEVPTGRYAVEILEKAGVLVRPVSLEEAAKSVVTKVSLNEADAGIVYATDVVAAGSAVEGVAIPADENVTAAYPVATVKASSQHRGRAESGSVVLTGGRRLIVSGAAPQAGEVFAVIPPRAVALFRAAPEGSPRNVWEGVVRDLDASGATVRVQLGRELPIVAEVTPAAVASLHLDEGDHVFVAVKALEIEVYEV